MDKISALNEILQLDPNNAFARYGLAMEHVARGNDSAALAEFRALIATSPDYIPAYQMCGQTLARTARVQEAIEVLELGLAAARRTGNSHAASEMQALVDDLKV